MTKYTNTSEGARGINVKFDKDSEATETKWIEPGQTLDLDDALITDKALPDGIEKGVAAAKAAEAAAAEAEKPAA